MYTPYTKFVAPFLLLHMMTPKIFREKYKLRSPPPPPSYAKFSSSCRFLTFRYKYNLKYRVLVHPNDAYCERPNFTPIRNQR